MEQDKKVFSLCKILELFEEHAKEMLKKLSLALLKIGQFYVFARLDLFRLFTSPKFKFWTKAED